MFQLIPFFGLASVGAVVTANFRPTPTDTERAVLVLVERFLRPTDTKRAVSVLVERFLRPTDTERAVLVRTLQMNFENWMNAVSLCATTSQVRHYFSDLRHLGT
mgnify:CR=1 FL=1